MSTREVLKQDLLTLDPKAFYLKHIVKSHNWYFSEYLHVPQKEIIDMMDYFKEIVSTNMGINFHSVQIVGSAKIGFSLSPRKVLSPFHNGDACTDSSDIDIAIVSENLYLHFWDLLRKDERIYNQTYYKFIMSSIFRGYINDKDLKKIDGIREVWDQLVSPINKTLQDKLCFEHPITYRIYRNWEDLEEYQLIGISKAREMLEGKKSV